MKRKTSIDPQIHEDLLTYLKENMIPIEKGFNERIVFPMPAAQFLEDISAILEEDKKTSDED